MVHRIPPLDVLCTGDATCSDVHAAACWLLAGHRVQAQSLALAHRVQQLLFLAHGHHFTAAHLLAAL